MGDFMDFETYKLYFDNASTTPIDENVIPIITNALKHNNYNPSSLYIDGRKNYEIILKAKEDIANVINADNKKQIFFTSGGTEGNNWAIRGYIDYLYKSKKYNIYNKTIKPHIITDTIEHHSVLNTIKFLEELNLVEVTYIKPDIETGEIKYSQIKDTIKPNTELISIMTINNVLGTVNNILDIGSLCKENNIKFHTDAVQAVGKININVNFYNIDFLTCSGHKIHCPKGIGFTYIRNSKEICPLLNGGLQEYGLRAGTENVAYIQALQYCINKYANKEYITLRTKKINILQNYLFNKLSNIFTDKIIFCGANGIINISFKNVISDSLTWQLGQCNIFVSVGSACDNGSFEGNYILKEMCYPKEYINGNIRLSFDERNSIEDCNRFILMLKELIQNQRGYI